MGSLACQSGHHAEELGLTQIVDLASIFWTTVSEAVTMYMVGTEHIPSCSCALESLQPGSHHVIWWVKVVLVFL